ncbi:MAG: DUF962 domain-containing protein [Xanthomonadaceae bacterium]|nr:DUF962 domain-containing protein [Xanthomonadaceae bacterium]
MATAFQSFRDFYPYYLSEHSNVVCRRLHFVGSWVALVFAGLAVGTLNPWWLLGALLSGYAFAWVGHFVFEKNRPATFRYPFYSFAGDWVMFADILRGKVRI